MSIRAIVAGITDIEEGLDSPSPAEVVGVVAHRLATRIDESFASAGFRLFDRPTTPGPWTHHVREAADELALDGHVPYALGRLYELLLAPVKRRRAGAHLTASHIAEGLVNCLDFGAVTTEGPARVLDPAVGGAAFLLAAASHQLALGHDADRIFDGLCGVDIDEGAVAVAEMALALWLMLQARPPRPSLNLQVGDALRDELPAVDVVVGNPPFLSQLARTSARSPARRKALQQKWGDLAGAYTDDAWLFIAAGLASLTRGALAMIQPLSILSARHAEPVRRLVADTQGLAGLWVPFVKVFDASVDVCGVVIDVGDPAGQRSQISRWSGADFSVEPSATPVVQAGEERPVTWGPLAAEMRGVPAVNLPPSGEHGRLASLATVTAGFRHQFYGLKPHVDEHGAAPDATTGQLVTVGMIDPLRLLWGTKPFAFAGDRYREPVVNLASLGRDDPTLMKWVGDRLRPKILVATQTRIVETWVDVQGAAVPATPVISVEPLDGADIWKLAAVLNAPVVNAWLAGASFGTALSVNAMKFSAHELGELPLPVVDNAWTRAAALLEQLHAHPEARGVGPFASAETQEEFAALMSQAYDDDTGASQWWRERLVVLMDRHG